MELATHKRKFSPRLKPLAACLATALAVSAGAFAPRADAKATPIDNGGLGSAPRASSSAPWTRITPVPSAMSLHHPIPHELPQLPANTVTVTNCNDSGSGSLRDALNNAADGDTIDMTGLSCSVISLTTGSLLFIQNNITLQGPGTTSLYLSGGSGASRVAPLLHDGTGTLTINDMTIEDGAKYFTDSQVDNARGGCVFSGGTVSLNDTEIKYCTAQNTGSTYGALGGAVYAAAGILMSNSTVIDSSVSSGVFGDGGGIFTPGSLTMADSFVEGNTASRFAGGVDAKGGALIKYSQISGNEAGAVGGVLLYGNATIENSTVSGNSANNTGGVWFDGAGATAPVTLLSSTVSGNNATTADFGGVFMYGAAGGRVANSTIAFNTTHYTGQLKYGAGLHNLATGIELESNIIAGNTNDSGSGPLDDDLFGSPSAAFSGANNLIVETGSGGAPGDTISADPKLAPLANNGGETATHAIGSPFSPAIDAGNNVANVSFDQRGSGYPRVIGAAADIGAFEFDPSDEIFFNGFDP